MKRRSFFGGLLGLVALPFAANASETPLAKTAAKVEVDNLIPVHCVEFGDGEMHLFINGQELANRLQVSFSSAVVES